MKLPAGSRGAAVLALLGVALAARSASAHSRGLSRSAFEVAQDGTVHAKLLLAAADLPAAARASEPGLAELAARGVDVRADGASCPAHFAGSRPDGPDGVELDVDFACAKGASVVEAELFLLSDLGASHEDVATMTSGAMTHQAVLDGAHRTIRLEIAPKKPGSSRVLVAIGASMLAALAALLVARRRQRR